MARTDTVEAFAQYVEDRHGLSSFHIFKQGAMWRAFGNRKEATGIKSSVITASVDEGRGKDIRAALENLDARLTAGPINRLPFPEEFR